MTERDDEFIRLLRETTKEFVDAEKYRHLEATALLLLFRLSNASRRPTICEKWS